MKLAYRFLKHSTQIAIRTFGHTRAQHTEYVPKTGGVLIVSNHQTFFDPLLVGVDLPRECHFMARDTLWKNERFGKIISYLNAFPVKRATADMTAMREAIKRLRDGHAIILFPEGLRTEDGRVGPFFDGPVLIARKAGVPIVPHVMVGGFEIWPRHRKLPRPGRIYLRFAPPISAEQVREWEPQRVATELHNRVLRMWEAGRARLDERTARRGTISQLNGSSN